MNRVRALAFALLALASVAMAQDAVSLRRKFEPAAKDIYKVTMTAKTTMDIPQLGEQQMSTTGSMEYTFLTDSVNEGKADLSISMTDIQFEMDGPMAQLMQGTPTMPSEIKFKGKMDERNRMSEFKVDGKLDPMAMMLANMNNVTTFFTEFPEGPVKLGDSWTVVIPKNPMIGSQDSKMVAKLEGEKDGKWVISMEGDITLNGDLSEFMKGQDPTGMGMEMVVKVKGVIKVKATSLVDKQTGKTVQMDMDMTTDSVTDIENLGLKTAQKATSKVAMSLVL
jgi:hypothetical protein